MMKLKTKIFLKNLKFLKVNWKEIKLFLPKSLNMINNSKQKVLLQAQGKKPIVLGRKYQVQVYQIIKNTKNNQIMI